MGSNSSAGGAPEHWIGVDDGKQTTETSYVRAHDGIWVEAVYTNETATVDLILEKYDRWLAEEEIKFVGLDLEYDATKKKVAVMQIAMREHVLVFHKIRCKQGYPSSLKDFIRNKQITFVGVDIRGDRRLLDKEWLHVPIQYHIDIQDIFKIEGTPYGRAGMAAMAGKLINENYLEMKSNFKHNMIKREGHEYWAWKPLSKKNLDYAILDGYVTYELYRRISLVNQGQVHLNNVAQCLPLSSRTSQPSKSEVGESSNSAKKRKSGWN